MWVLLYRFHEIFAFRKNFVLDYANLFSPNCYKKNEKIVFKYFLDLTLKKLDERRNDPLYEIEHNDLMSEKYKETCKYLNYFSSFQLILASAVTCSVSIFAFASLACVPVGITSSAVGLKICAITARIRKYKPIIKKEKKKYDKIMLLGKTKLDTIEVQISNALIDSYIFVNTLYKYGWKCREKYARNGIEAIGNIDEI